jgi:hypothetical protein
MRSGPALGDFLFYLFQRLWISSSLVRQPKSLQPPQSSLQRGCARLRHVRNSA